MLENVKTNKEPKTLCSRQTNNYLKARISSSSRHEIKVVYLNESTPKMLVKQGNWVLTLTSKITIQTPGDLLLQSHIFKENNTM